jgi:hypothetical protein
MAHDYFYTQRTSDATALGGRDLSLDTARGIIIIVFEHKGGKM